MASRRSTRGATKTFKAENEDEGEPAPNPPPARPRRRREQSEASAFLTKTFNMISNLDGVVGGWSEKGDTMIVWDAEKFAAEIIPQYFKHNNFRSFVRQLNFYGFRKLRADAQAGPAATAKWEFKHPNFQRERRDLLVLIRRAEHYDHAGADVAEQRKRQLELEREVGDLRTQVAELRGLVDQIVGGLGAVGVHLDGGPPPPKRSKVDRQDSEQQFLERLPSSVRVGSIDFAPNSLDGHGLQAGLTPRLAHARGLEGQPLRRVAGDKAGPAPAPSLESIDGAPISLNSFEASRLDSLVRVASVEAEEGA